jgi:hypothetical protein
MVLMRPEIWTRPPPISGPDDGRRDHFALAFLDQHDRHPLADIVARDILEDARAGRVERQMDRGFVGLGVKTGLRVSQTVAGQHHLLPDQKRQAVTFNVEFGAERQLTGLRCFEGARGFFDHADFQRRRAAENVLGLGRVLHARQLDDDAVGTLLSDHRFGYTEFVDPVVQRRHVLPDCELLDSLHRLGLERADQPQVFAFALVGQQQVGLVVLDKVPRLAARFGVTEANEHPLALAADAAVADRLVAQQTAQVSADRVQPFGQSALHVHLEEEMHPAAQIEAEIHRQGAQAGQPLR